MEWRDRRTRCSVLENITRYAIFSFVFLFKNATYGTLPSPSNLKRWQITTESSCFLCHKIVCTTAHILGACQITLGAEILFVCTFMCPHFFFWNDLLLVQG